MWNTLSKRKEKGKLATQKHDNRCRKFAVDNNCEFFKQIPVNNPAH